MHDLLHRATMSQSPNIIITLYIIALPFVLICCVFLCMVFRNEAWNDQGRGGLLSLNVMF